MGNGWQEWPLILFTVFGQCVVGGFIVTGLAWCSSQDDRSQQLRIARTMVFLWVLMGMGFLASMIHLGSPLRAFNSLHRVGASALSNEIAMGVLFFVTGGLWWLVAVLGKMPQAAGKLWLCITMVIGLAFIWAMTRVYQIDTVPTWRNSYTTMGFFMTVLICGPLLGTTLLSTACFVFNSSKFAILSILAFLVSAGATLMQSVSLAEWHSSVSQATQLVPDYGVLQISRMILIVLGLGCWICPLLRHSAPRTVYLLAGVVLVIAGEILGRGVFYGLHMTVGVSAG